VRFEEQRSFQVVALVGWILVENTAVVTQARRPNKTRGAGIAYSINLLNEACRRWGDGMSAIEA